MPDEPRRRRVCRHRRSEGDDRRHRLWPARPSQRGVPRGRRAGAAALCRYPKTAGVEGYIAAGAVPGGTGRNFASYGHLMGEMPAEWRDLLCDPQTSGGLLLAVTPEAEAEVQAAAAEFGIKLAAIGELVTARGGRPMIEIR